MKEALLRMLSSMKVWTMIIGGLVTACGSWLAKHQMDVSDAAVQQFAASAVLLVSILIHAQGKTDTGKEAARLHVEGRAPEAAPLTATPTLAPDPAPEVKS
jgi:hypothetical protein